MADPWSVVSTSKDDWAVVSEQPLSRKPAAKPKKPGFLQRVGQDIAGSVETLKKSATDYADSEAAYMKRGKPLSWGEQFGQTAKFGNVLKNAAGVAVSPVNAVFEQGVVQPGANLLDRLPAVRMGRNGYEKMDPAQAHEENANALRTGISAVMPARAGPPTPPRFTGKAPNALTERTAAFDRANVDPMLATGGKGSAMVTNTIAENPIAGARVRAGLRKRVGQVQATADTVAGSYGAPRGAQIAGEEVQAGVKRFAADRNTTGTFAEKSGRLYDDAFANIPNQPVTPTATAQTLADIQGRVNAPTIGEAIKSPKISEITDALTKDAGKITFNDLRELRTWVRNARKDPALRQNVAEADLGRLEAALTADIRTSSEALGGPDAARRLLRADQFYAKGQARIKTALEAFSGEKGTAGESTYRRIIQAAQAGGSADAQRLLSLKRSLAPDEWGDVAATTIQRLGQVKPGAVEGVPTGDEFSIANFVTNYANMSARGREIMFGSVGGGGSRAGTLKAELDNLINVAGALKGVEKGANASKTWVNAQAGGTLVMLLNPKTTLPTAGFLAGFAVTGEMMTNPAMVRAVTNLTRAAALGPKALEAAVAQLSAAAAKNRVLVPVAQAALAAQRGYQAGAPLAVPAAATEEPTQ